MTPEHGMHVTYTHEGRELLGEVTAVDGGRVFAKFFNGEPWPVTPPEELVTVLRVDYPEEEP